MIIIGRIKKKLFELLEPRTADIAQVKIWYTQIFTYVKITKKTLLNVICFTIFQVLTEYE